jgi:hypothetical protein
MLAMVSFNVADSLGLLTSLPICTAVFIHWKRTVVKKNMQVTLI